MLPTNPLHDNKIKRLRALASKGKGGDGMTRGKKGSRKARLKLKLLDANEKIQRLEKEIGQMKTSGSVPRRRHFFYDSREWRELRYVALKKYGRKCQLCGSAKAPMHVDHVKPRSKYPELELCIENLQVLCADCNLGKSNKHEDDWRPQEETR